MDKEPDKSIIASVNLSRNDILKSGICDTMKSIVNTLKDIDIDVLKLDMRFLSGTENSEKSKIIIPAVINMASALGLPVIAEGLKQGSRRTCCFPSAANICKGIISAGRYLPRNMKKCFMTQTG